MDQLLSIASALDNFNFDMLQALVEECIRYDEDPDKAIQLMNINQYFKFDHQYKVDLKVDGRVVPTNNYIGRITKTTAINSYDICSDEYSAEVDDIFDNGLSFVFTQSNISFTDSKNKIYGYELTRPIYDSENSRIIKKYVKIEATFTKCNKEFSREKKFDNY